METGAGIERLEGGGLHDSALEERVKSSSLGNKVVHDGTGSGGLSHGGDLGLVAVEETNVLLNPFKGSTLIVNSEITDTLCLRNWSVQPSEGTKLLQF